LITKANLKRRDTRAYATADSRFHEAFFTHRGNSYLVSAFKNASGRVAALRAHLTVPQPHEQLSSFAEHEAIVAAFAAGARKEIRQTLTEHSLRTKIYFTSGNRYFVPRLLGVECRVDPGNFTPSLSQIRT
jgi:DNA-binding GntR family transcriptional regulator